MIRLVLRGAGEQAARRDAARRAIQGLVRRVRKAEGE